MSHYRACINTKAMITWRSREIHDDKLLVWHFLDSQPYFSIKSPSTLVLITPSASGAVFFVQILLLPGFLLPVVFAEVPQLARTFSNPDTRLVQPFLLFRLDPLLSFSLWLTYFCSFSLCTCFSPFCNIMHLLPHLFRQEL